MRPSLAEEPYSRHLIGRQMRDLFIGSMLVVFALATGCGKQQSNANSSGASDDQSQDSLETRVDKHGDEIMASAAKGEAREWMKDSKHVFFKSDPKQVAQFLEDFYNAGATQVLIGDVEDHDGAQYGGSILVVLPTDATTRAKLFQVGSRADTAYDQDPVTDKGQKYLYYSLD